MYIFKHEWHKFEPSWCCIMDPACFIFHIMRVWMLMMLPCCVCAGRLLLTQLMFYTCPTVVGFIISSPLKKPASFFFLVVDGWAFLKSNSFSQAVMGENIRHMQWSHSIKHLEGSQCLYCIKPRQHLVSGGKMLIKVMINQNVFFCLSWSSC